MLAWRRGDLGLLLVAGALFSIWPEWDLAVSGWFHQPGAGFYLRETFWVQLLYRGATWVLVALALGALLVLVVGSLSPPQDTRARQARRGAAAFFLAAVILGPGLVVNGLFKSHWGRARPAQVQEFGGQRLFTAALQPSRQCAKNCSFVSGHASIGFVLMAFACIFRRQRRLWLLAGLGAGALVGLARIAQGGHFVSDVVFSGFVVWFSILALEWLRRNIQWIRLQSLRTGTWPIGPALAWMPPRARLNLRLRRWTEGAADSA